METSEERPLNGRRRRRRRLKAQPVSAKLALDERVKGDVGTISQDLFADILRRRSPSEREQDDVHYIAITPWRPSTALPEEDCLWTIVPVKIHSTPGSSSTIRFPASSIALQSFAAALHANKIDIKTKNGFQILALDVQPLQLETVFVRIDGDALRKHEEVQRKFGGGFLAAPNPGMTAKGKGKAIPHNHSRRSGNDLELQKEMEKQLRDAVRSALASPAVVHRNDRLPLPLPAHPITHVPFPLSEVISCEPVDQGLLSQDTKIVVDIEYQGVEPKRPGATRTRSEPLSRMISEEVEEGSTENFYSAVENDEDEEPEVTNAASTTEESDEDSLSDDSADNMISLNSPSLPLHASGVFSSKTAATPRPFDAHINGVRTPGSVYSNYTATTARQSENGRSFNLKPLVAKVPGSLLVPSPGFEEDDEARVFVDMKMLVRLGCFSGDWVKLIIPPHANDGTNGLWTIGAFGDDEPIENFRTVKIYGLPDIGGNDIGQYPKTDFARRLSNSSVLPLSRPSPNAYISPILFYNMGQPSSVTISVLAINSQSDKKFSRSKLSSSAIPPIAKEVTLLRLATPLSTERAMQAGLLAKLKQHFGTRRRILKKGDLVALSISTGVSRMYADSAPSNDADNEFEELLAGPEDSQLSSEDSIGIAWFKVSQISGSVHNEDQTSVDPVIWGDISTIEPMTTRMVQAGSAQSKLPPVQEVPWEVYLGTKLCPKSIMGTPSVITILNNSHKHSIPPIQRRIRELLAVATSAQASTFKMKPIVILLHSTQRRIGKTYLTSIACADLGLNIFPINSYDILTESQGGGDVKTEGSLRAKIERALTCGAEFVVPLIQHIEALTADRMASAIKDMLEELRALVITTTDIEKVPNNIRSLVTHELEVSAPDEGEREGILTAVTNERGIRLAYDVDLASMAMKTAALVAGDLVDVVDRALIFRQNRLEAMSSASENILIRDIVVSGGSSARCVTKTDFESAVDAARKNFADSIGAPKIPNVTWDDVGGLTNVKDAVMETIQLPLERPELFAKGMKKRSGILFYGPPGTGKTLLAKAIATEFSLNFFSVKGPELLNMYIGESEANVRRVFQRARDARPCVVFFDELDSVAPKRGNQGDSGGVMDRIVSQLLAELDGMSGGDEGAGGVFVIGATNRPDLLDQALLRPGRFDKMLYLGVSDTHDKQLTILEALTRKFALHPELSLRRVAEHLPFTYTGADLYALCSDAMLKAITRKASAVDRKIKALPDGPVTTAYFFDHLATKEDIAVMVTEEDFEAASRELIGSVR